MSELVTVGKTHWQGRQDPSKSVSIFDRETEANFKMGSYLVTRSPCHPHARHATSTPHAAMTPCTQERACEDGEGGIA